LIIQSKKITHQDLKGALLEINLKSKSLSYTESYPTLYLERQPFPRVYYFADLEPISDEKMIVSFPASNNLIITNMAGYRKEVYAGSDKFEAIRAKSNQKTDDEYFHNTNYSFRGVRYDPYRKLTYRILGRPISEPLLKDSDPTKSKWKRLTVIVLDENFNKIAETDLPDEYEDSVIFVSKEGLCIWNYKKTFLDEENFYFDVFKIVQTN
jgi:hypothetical protein